MKTSSNFLLITILLLCSVNINAQKITGRDNRVWLGYVAQTKTSKNLSIWTDAHWVSNGFLILRPGLTWHFNNKANLTTTLGYAHLWIHPAPGNKTYRPEHRAWGQTTASFNFNKLLSYQRLRYEARFRQTIIDDHLQNEFNFNYRLRYLFQIKYRILTESPTKAKPYLLVSDELGYNLGREIKNGFRLDQNRFSAGVGITKGASSLQLAYLNQLLESASSETFSMNHHIQLLLFQNFDLTKLKSKK